jgi:hypothetical protein
LLTTKKQKSLKKGQKFIFFAKKFSLEVWSSGRWCGCVGSKMPLFWWCLITWTKEYNSLR